MLDGTNKNFIFAEGENIISLVRQAKFKLCLALSLPVLLIALAFFFLYPLFSLGKKGIIIFGLLLVIGLLLVLRNIFIWYAKLFIITNLRITDIDRQGIFKKIVSDIPLKKIQDVFYQSKGIVQTIGGLGNLEIILTDAKTKIEFKDIKNPQKIQNLILQLRSESEGGKIDIKQLSAQELVNLVKKIKAEVGPERFNRILEQAGDEKIESN
ncbi:MAG: PH domain-containing protein [Patescibacteria group bacterium]